MLEDIFLPRYFNDETKQPKSCKSLWLQLAYCCLIGNESNTSISILDIQQNYAHLVVYTHEAFGPVAVNWVTIYQIFSMWNQYFKEKSDYNIT